MDSENKLLSLHSQIFQTAETHCTEKIQTIFNSIAHFFDFDIGIACCRESRNGEFQPLKIIPEETINSDQISAFLRKNRHINSLSEKKSPVIIDAIANSNGNFLLNTKMYSLVAIPLTSKYSVDGCIIMLWKKHNILSRNDKIFIENLSSFLNSNIFRHNKIESPVSIIKKIGRDLHSEIQNNQKLIENIVSNAAKFTGAEFCCLVLYDEIARKLVCAYGQNCSLCMGADANKCSFNPSEKHRLLCKVFRKGQPEIIRDIDLERYKSNTKDKAGKPVKSQLAVPLRKGKEKTVGVLVLEHSASNFFQPGDIELTRALGEVSVYVLNNSELFQNNNKMIEKLRLLSDASDVLLSEYEEHELDYKFDHIVSKATQILDAELCSLWIADGSDVVLTSSYRNLNGKIEKWKNIGLRLQIKPNSGLTGHVAYTKKVLNLDGDELLHHNAVNEQDPSDFLSTKRCYSALNYPMLDKDNNLIGILNAFNKKDDKGRVINHAGFSEELDVPLMKILTTKLIISIKNASLVKKLSESIDQLTNFKLIIESTSDLALITGVNARITYMNKGAIELLGDKIGRRITDCFYSDEISSSIAKVRENTRKLRGSKEETFKNRETKLIGKNGEAIPVSFSASFIRDNAGKIIGSIGIGKDLRDAKTVLELGRRLMSLQNVDQILAAVTKECLRKLPLCIRAYAKLYDEKTDTLLYKALAPRRTGEKLPEEPSPTDRGITGFVFQNQVFHISGNVSQEPANKHFPLFQGVKSSIAIPFNITDRKTKSTKTVGILIVDSEHLDAFTSNNQYFLLTLANQAAAAIDNAQLIESQSKIIKELSALQAVEEVITTAHDINKIKEVVLDVVKDILGFDSVFISEVNIESQMIGATMGKGVQQEFLDAAWHPLSSKDIQAWVVKHKEDVKLTGWDDRLDKAIFEKFQHEKLVRVYLPMIARDGVLGTLEARYEKIHKSDIDEEELEILRKVVNLAGIGIDQVNLVKKQEKNLTQLRKDIELRKELENHLQALFQASIDIQLCQTENEASQFVFNSLRKIGYNKSMISLINKHDGIIDGKWAMGENWLRIKHKTKRPLNGHDILAISVRKKRPLLSKECAADSRCDQDAIREAGIKSQYVIPLVVKNEAIGTLQIDLSDKPELVFGDENVFNRRMRVIETFVNQAAIAIRNIRDIARIDFLETSLTETAHEFRSPLHNILAQMGGLRNLIEDKYEKEKEVDDYVNVISEEINRVKRQMDNTLLLSKKSINVIGFNFESGFIQDVIFQCINSHRMRAMERGISLQVRDSVKRLPKFHFDHHKINQVFTNLIDNAIKYSLPNKYIQITGFDDGTKINITLRDRGVGIPEDQYDTIFKSFARTQNQDKNRYIPGTGLGLKIVKEIIEGHGGVIKVKSTPVHEIHRHGKYDNAHDTEFTIILPKMPKGKKHVS